ncbi:MAG: hypothetical protein COA58_09135 [Bacteroidetes bacterium]|nr:MAG: hypothetical protein COA58_09135 [Bacteroidota bacterium]
MKNIKYSLFILFGFLLFSACTELESLPSEIAKPKSFDAEHRGIYINRFKSDGILGDATQEDLLLNWCVQNDFNEVTLYNINAIMDTEADRTALNAFVGKAHTWEPAIKVGFINAGTTSFEETRNYLLDGSYPNKPDAVTTEYEYWNDPYSYESFIPLMSGITSLKIGPDAIDAAIERQHYVSRFEDEEEVWSSNIIHKQAINNADEIFLVNYHSNAQEFNVDGAYHNKLRGLALHADSVHLTQDVVVLFSVNRDSGDPNIWDYVEEHGFDAAFQNWMEGYEDAEIDFKERLNIVGYQFYKYSEAMEAVPYED